jgi:hypothetical protein
VADHVTTYPCRSPDRRCGVRIRLPTVFIAKYRRGSADYAVRCNYQSTHSVTLFVSYIAVREHQSQTAEAAHLGAQSWVNIALGYSHQVRDLDPDDAFGGYERRTSPPSV